jgi:hypothetical protein
VPPTAGPYEPHHCDAFVTDRYKARSIVRKNGQRLVPTGGGWGWFGWHTVPADATTIVVTEGAVPDRHRYGAAPQLLREHRGPQAQALIDRIEAAVQRYPWPRTYRAWPGPNSNTFVAWVAREVPELGLDLPAHAIGKDWLGPSTFVAPAPSGTGWQLSAWGLAGVTLARDEGLELQLLGLGFGVDVQDARLRLPGVGSWPGTSP